MYLACKHDIPYNVHMEMVTIRRQIDITTYQLLFFLSDTSLCLFGDELIDILLLVAVQSHCLVFLK